MYTFWALLCSTALLQAQVSVVNDECNQAILLMQEANCLPIQGSVLNATESLSPCTPYSSVANDVWYSFVANSSDVSIHINNTAMDLAFEVLSGACNALTVVACVDSELAGMEESLSFIDLVAGETYFVRVYENENNALNSTFDICISDYTRMAAPVNDECAAAIVLIPSLSPIAIFGTTLGATESMPENACASVDGYAADVWYTFVATDTTATIIVKGQDYFDAIVEVFEGDCNTLASIECVDNTIVNASTRNLEETILLNTVVGESYFIRVYDYYGPLSSDNNFTISLQSLDPINVCDTINLVLTLDGCSGMQTVTNIEGGMAPYTYEWSTGDTGVSVANLIAGETYSVSVSDANGCSITSTFEQTICNAIDKVALDFEMDIYPNPAESVAILSLQTEKAMDLQIELVDIMGQVLSTQAIVNQGIMTYNLAIDDLAVGVYFIKVYSKEGAITKRFIVNK